MSLKLQQQKMKEIGRLLAQDLSYIHGEKESGSNGAKREFLNKSAAFLRQLGKDMGFKEMNVKTNPSGIASSGSVSIYGMWGRENGLYFEITQSTFGLLYHEIKHLKDYSGGQNRWLSLSIFQEADYEALCGVFLNFNKEAKANAA